jgi:hypothetical protein
MHPHGLIRQLCLRGPVAGLPRDTDSVFRVIRRRSSTSERPSTPHATTRKYASRFVKGTNTPTILCDSQRAIWNAVEWNPCVRPCQHNIDAVPHDGTRGMLSIAARYRLRSGPARLRKIDVPNGTGASLPCPPTSMLIQRYSGTKISRLTM